MLVVLTTAAVMLAFNTLNLYERDGDTKSGSPSMTLQHMTSELIWVNDSDAHPAITGEIHQELTPFFFEPVRINLASEEMLSTLPRIGPGLAKKIVAFRKKHGPIQSKEDFMHIEGIGVKRFADLENHISFH
jgi:DNA uptake protein ComE-like DNA-binding protein